MTQGVWRQDEGHCTEPVWGSRELEESPSGPQLSVSAGWKLREGFHQRWVLTGQQGPSGCWVQGVLQGPGPARDPAGGEGGWVGGEGPMQSSR